MDQKRVILAAVIALIAAAVVLGLIIAIGGLLPNLFGTNNNNPISNLPVISTSITPAPTYTLSGTPVQSSITPTVTPKPSITITPTANTNTKYYLGDGFSLQYPNSWGILTCSNSKNFELDPVNGTDMLDVSCNRSVKPITVIVHNGYFACPGSPVNIGNNSATKSTKTWSDGEIDYRWCVVVNGKTLDITHRTSPNGGVAVSTTDYSSQVEDMIKTISSTQPSHS